MRFTFALSILLLSSCTNSGTNSNLKPLDLMKYNVPITIMAPDSAQVQTMDLVVQKDVSIKKGDDFYVQLFMSEASSFQVPSILAKLKAEVQQGAYFSKFIKEEEAGFIFENALDSLHKSYDFRHVKLQGDKEFEFRTGLIGSFGLEAVEVMYEAVSKTN